MKIPRNLATLGLLALFALPANAQDQSSTHPSLRSLPALIEAANHATQPIPIAPALVDDALLIDEALVTPQGKLEVTLRNGSERTITAWSVDLTVGSGSGEAAVTSYAVDKLTGLLPSSAPIEHSPLRPNESRRVEYDTPLAHDRSTVMEDRLAHGDYSVVGVKAGAVVFDDGSVAGHDVRRVLGFVLQRYARAASLSRLLGRVDSALQDGTLQQHLEDSLEHLKQENTILAKAIVNGSGPVTALDSQRQQEAMLLQQWVHALLVSTLRSNPRSELEDLGLLGPGLEPAEALRMISARPAMLRGAVEHARSAYQLEWSVVRENLPAELRADIDRIAARPIEP